MIKAIVGIIILIGVKAPITAGKAAIDGWSEFVDSYDTRICALDQGDTYSTLLFKYKGANVYRTNGLITKYYVGSRHCDVTKSFYKLDSALHYIDEKIKTPASE